MKLKIFYLYSFLVLFVILNFIYIIGGALEGEGYGLSNIILIGYSIILAIIPTLIYFIFTFDKKYNKNNNKK